MARTKSRIQERPRTPAIKNEYTDKIKLELEYSISDDTLLVIKELAMNGNNNYALAGGLGISEKTLYNWYTKSPTLREWVDINRSFRDNIANNSLVNGLRKDAYLAFQYLQKKDKSLQSNATNEGANLTQVNINIETLNNLSKTELDELLKGKLISNK